MFLEIITPDKSIFSGQAKVIQLPGTKGTFEILSHHAPIISTLEKGKIKVVDENDQEHFFEINGGVIENKDNKIIILAESL